MRRNIRPIGLALLFLAMLCFPQRAFAAAGVRVSMEANKSTAVEGEQVTCTLLVHNTGDVPLTGVNCYIPSLDVAKLGQTVPVGTILRMDAAFEVMGSNTISLDGYITCDQFPGKIAAGSSMGDTVRGGSISNISTPSSGTITPPPNNPTDAPRVTATPRITNTPKATTEATEGPTRTPKATATPKNTATPKATATPKPTTDATQEPTQTPKATSTPKSSDGTATPKPGATDAADASGGGGTDATDGGDDSGGGSDSLVDLALRVETPHEAKPGDKVNFTLKLVNTGEETLHNVRVVCSEIGLSAEVGDLAKGKTWNNNNEKVSYTIPENTSSDLELLFETYSDETTKQTTATVRIVGIGKLSVEATADKAEARPGDAFEIKVQLYNLGDARLSNVKVVVPAMNFEQDLGDIEANEIRTAIVPGVMPEDYSEAPFSVEVQASADNHAVQAETVELRMIEPEFPLTLTKSVDKLSASPGDTVEISVAIANTSASQTITVEVTDTRRPGLNQTLTIAPGATETLTERYTIPKVDMGKLDLGETTVSYNGKAVTSPAENNTINILAAANAPTVASPSILIAVGVGIVALLAILLGITMRPKSRVRSGPQGQPVPRQNTLPMQQPMQPPLRMGSPQNLAGPRPGYRPPMNVGYPPQTSGQVPMQPVPGQPMPMQPQPMQNPMGPPAQPPMQQTMQQQYTQNPWGGPGGV